MNNLTDSAKSTKIKLSVLSGSRDVTPEISQKAGRRLAVGRYVSDNDLTSGMNNNDLIIGCSGQWKDRRLCYSEYTEMPWQYGRYRYKRPALSQVE